MGTEKVHFIKWFVFCCFLSTLELHTKVQMKCLEFIYNSLVGEMGIGETKCTTYILISEAG